MNLRRTIVAILLSLTLAFAPTVASAMARPCVGTGMVSSVDMTGVSMSGKVPTPCPCEKAMPSCGGLTQCQVGPGCGTQCLELTAIMSGSEPLTGLALTRFGFGVNERVASLSMAPPAPPPRG